MYRRERAVSLAVFLIFTFALLQLYSIVCEIYRGSCTLLLVLLIVRVASGKQQQFRAVALVSILVVMDIDIFSHEQFKILLCLIDTDKEEVG